MVRGEVDHVSAETLKDASAAKAMEKLALSVDANAQKWYIEKLRGLSRDQLAILLKNNFFDPKRKKFKNYETITKSYVYYGLLEMVLDKLGFDITVTGLWWSKLKQQVVEFERRYGLAVDSGLAGRQVLTTMYELMQWYTMQSRTPYKTHDQIVNDEEPSKNGLLTVDKRFYRKAWWLQAYLRTPEYHASVTGKPRIFKVGIKSWVSRSERREKSHVFFMVVSDM